MADEEEPEYDIAINVRKGAEGYGIYFTQLSDDKIQVTKLDCGSEAERSGVRANDFLHSVTDLDKKLPLDAPGQEVKVGSHNYHDALSLVRQMKYCRLTFKTQGFS